MRTHLKQEAREQELRQALFAAGVQLESNDLSRFAELFDWYGFEIVKDSPFADRPFINKIAPGHFFGYNTNFDNPPKLEEEMRRDLLWGRGLSETSLVRPFYFSSLEEAEKALALEKLSEPFHFPSAEELKKEADRQSKAIMASIRRTEQEIRNKMMKLIVEEKDITPDPDVKGGMFTEEQTTAFLNSNSDIQPLLRRVVQEAPELTVKTCWEWKTPCGTLFQIVNFTDHAIVVSKDRHLIIDGYKVGPFIQFTADNCQLIAYNTSEDVLIILDKDIGKEEIQKNRLKKDPEYYNVWEYV